MLRFLIFILTALLLGACQKRDPNPELSDRIYSDLKSELANAETQAAELEKKIAEMAKEMKDARPQSGDFKRFQKYFFQHQNGLAKYKQQIIYWKIRIAQRKAAIQVEYSQAFDQKKPWPDPKEYEEYLNRKKLRLAKIEWDVKQRMSDSKTPRSPASGGAHGASAAEEKPAH